MRLPSGKPISAVGIEPTINSVSPKIVDHNGFSNSLEHVRREHPSFKANTRKATKAETGSRIHNARMSVNRFGWLEWVVQAKLPLVFL